MPPRTATAAILLIACIRITAYAQVPAQAPSPEPPDSILAQLDRRIQESMATGDVDVLERYLGASLVFTHGWFSGGVQSKREVINAAQRVPRFYLSRRVSAQVVEAHDDVALVLGRLDVQRQPLPANGETEQMCYATHYVHLYIRREGRWQLISHRTAQNVEPRRPCAP